MKMTRAFVLSLALVAAFAAVTSSGETLYNGIVLPDEWPPRYEAEELLPMPVPYLEKANLPAVIPIDLGRQLAELKSVSGDKTKLAVGDVGNFAGKDVRLSFALENATLYSFWVSKDKSGKSGGYLAGGGPGYRGLRDE